VKLREKYKNDLAIIMSKKHANGGDLWSTEDNNIGKGSPFSTRDVALILTELGFTKKDLIVNQIADLFFEAQQPDGRFKMSIGSAIYPCHTIGSLRVLCYLGYSKDKRLIKTFDYLLNTQQDDGGWQCHKFSFGRGPETNYSNTGPTLEALDAFRFIDTDKTKLQINKAIHFLLWHWEKKEPIGPCHFGMGTLFNKTEFPFFRYNIFYYTYVLSFYQKATKDKKFKEAYLKLKTKLKDGEMVIENPNKLLANLDFCKKEEPSLLATKRFLQIEKNL
jgi:hypothetical protein